MLLPQTDRNRKADGDQPAVAPGEFHESVDDCWHSEVLFPAAEYFTRGAARIQFALDDLVKQVLNLDVGGD